MSDDLSMKALSHDLVANAKRSLDAGYNLVYTVSDSKETIKILKTYLILIILPKKNTIL